MRRARRALLASILAAGAATAWNVEAKTALPTGMLRVPGGSYEPFQRAPGEQSVSVPSFALDVTPTTNAEFLAFVAREPQWRRSAVSRLFAEPSYLSHWEGDLELGANAEPEQPVTFVSWFAALAYCRSIDASLPTEAQWELAAAPTGEDEASRARATQRTLDFYARPRTRLPHVGSTQPNAYEIRDLQGVIWEWVLDFNASLSRADGRREGDAESDAYCGGAGTAGDVADYATFLRFGLRGSLEATYALHHLGFRCAKDLP